MKTYVVGGAVRDELLGLPVRDKDHVVVGSTPEEMIAQGFKPVGKDFPVFLHPQTHEEYALARTERKSGRGYKGFTVYAAPEVTLEDDLRRRDLTINAIAKDENGALIDPFGGKEDLKNKTLKHVSEAFSEDPVRILRVARFAARFGFAVHPDTMTLMKRMVADGEADYLVPERVWQEFAKGLAEPQPQRMFEILQETGVAQKLLPELKNVPSTFSGPLAVRFARLAWPLEEKEALALSERLKAPGDVRDLAVLASTLKKDLHPGTAESVLAILKRADAFRRPDRFAQLLEVAKQADPSIDDARLKRSLAAAAGIDAGAIAAAAGSQAEIPKRIDEARLAAITQAK